LERFGGFSLRDFSKSHEKLEQFFFWITCFISFAVYLRTLCPTVYIGDSGELIAAAYTLGIAHPPGYPLYCLLGKGFTFLPFGNIAYRINLLSAFFASLTVGMVYLILLHLLRKKEAPSLKRPILFACTGALFYGFSRDFWSQAVSAEVYTLNTFFFALLLYLLLRWIEEKKKGILFLSAYLLGLGIGNHHTLLVFGPLFSSVVLLEEPFLLKDFRFLGKAIFLLGLGLSVYLYLPLRALARPDANWGVLPSLKSVFYHILMLQYRDLGPAAPRSVSLYLEELVSFFQTCAEQGVPLLWVFSFLGFWRLYSKDARGWFAATFLFLETSLLLIIVVNFETSSSSLYLMRPFYLPAWMVLSLFWGVGISECFSFLTQRFHFTRSLVVGCLVFPLFLFLRNFPLNDLSGHRLAEDFGRDLLDTIRPRGILFVSGDDPHFILAYLKIVEHCRPDVEVFGLESGPFGKIQKKNFFKFSSEHQEFPIYSNTRTLSTPSGFQLKTNGLLYQLVKKGTTVPKAVWESYRVRDPARVEADDLFEKFILTRYFWMKGEARLEEGNQEEARKEFRAVSTLAGTQGFIHTQLGIFYISMGWAKEGLASFQEALRLNPYDPEVWKGLGIVIGQLGHYQESVRLLERAVERRPTDSEITFNLGVSYGNLRQFDRAIFWWRRTLFLNPLQHTAVENIQKAKVFSAS